MRSPALPKPVGTKIVADTEVSFGAAPNIVRSGNYTFFAGSRSDAFFFDFDGIKDLFDTRGGRNFTAPHLGGKSPWTGVDSNTEANVGSTVIELPTSELAGKPGVRIWGRCSVRRDGKLLHVDRAGHPSVSSFFNTDDTKEEYNASEPVNDRTRWLEMFIHLMGHTGNYTREEAIAAIDAHALLPDMLNFDPTRPAQVSQWPRLHRRRHQRPALVPLQGRYPARRPQAAHRHAAGVPLSRHAASGEKLEPIPSGWTEAGRKGRQGKHLAHAGRAAQLVRPEAEHGTAAAMGDALRQQQLSDRAPCRGSPCGSPR